MFVEIDFFKVIERVCIVCLVAIKYVALLESNKNILKKNYLLTLTYISFVINSIFIPQFKATLNFQLA